MPRFSNRPFLATTLSFLSSRAADLPAASQGWNERVDIEPLPTHERFCFVSGHDFSRAETQPSTMGFSPCSYLEHILFIRSEASGPLKRARAVVGAVATPSPRDSAWKGVLTHAPKPCPSFDSETPYQWVK